MAILRVSERGSRIVFAMMGLWSFGMGVLGAWGQAPPPDPRPAAEEVEPHGGQVLTQGPVHEAFAAPVVHDPHACPVIARQPPAAIREQPPDEKPTGQNIQWIPGYWAWDGTRNDYLWVSGLWREPPPGSQWVPGYWHPVQGGYQWVAGSWMPAATGPAPGQATYLPAPPQSLETGPNAPPPSPNVTWTPGYWAWQATGYVWRPGFWAAVQPNWIWVPAHYVWTPSGSLFVPGYWDLPVANRGLLFAPVYYPQPVYAQPSFVYVPSISIVGSAVTANLFVQASTNQYLFGDYYAQNYVSVGIVPWFSFTFVSGRPAYYDPLFSYYSVVNVRENPRWVAQVRETYVQRRENVALRPPRTYVEQTRMVNRNVTINRNVTVVDHRTMAMPLHRLASDPVAGKNLKLERVKEAERQQWSQRAAQLQEFRQERLRQEQQGSRGGMATRPRAMNLPHSPIAARHPSERPGGSASAPPAHPGGGGGGGRGGGGAHAAAHPNGAGASAPGGAAPRAEPRQPPRLGAAHAAAGPRAEPTPGRNPAGPRAAMAQHPEPAREAAPKPIHSGPAPGAAAAAAAAEPNRPAPGPGAARLAPAAAAGVHRPAPGGSPLHPQARPGMARPGLREPPRSASPPRGREASRAAQEEERRRRSQP